MNTNGGPSSLLQAIKGLSSLISSNSTLLNGDSAKALQSALNQFAGGAAVASRVPCSPQPPDSTPPVKTETPEEHVHQHRAHVSGVETRNETAQETHSERRGRRRKKRTREQPRNRKNTKTKNAKRKSSDVVYLRNSAVFPKIRRRQGGGACGGCFM